MEDRFKFRAWDLDQKQFTYFHLGETQSPAPWDMDYINQCTALKDKNGKLIFEGDILNFINMSPGFGGNYPDIVKWEASECGYGPMATVNTEDFDFEYEILGNVYENPELLKDK